MSGRQRQYQPCFKQQTSDRPTSHSIPALILLPGLLFSALSTAQSKSKSPSDFQIRRPAQCQEIFTTGPDPVAFDYLCAKRDVTRLWVPLNQITPLLKELVVGLEDSHFYRHNGIDTDALFDAFKHDLKVGKFARGGSTITQQLVKNLYLTKEKTLTRKVREVSLSLELEKNLSKKQILELYLNTIEWGPGVYGAEATSRLYFEKHASEIGEYEAWMLALMIPNPKELNLWVQPRGLASLKRRATKLSYGLKAKRHLSDAQRKELLLGFFLFLDTWRMKRPEALWLGRERFPAVWQKSNLRIMDVLKKQNLSTTLDPRAQAALESELTNKKLLETSPRATRRIFAVSLAEGSKKSILAIAPLKKPSPEFIVMPLTAPLDKFELPDRAIPATNK